MCKKVFCFLLVLGLCAPVWAECRGGTEYTDTNNHTYCISDIKMNWWTAFSWCQANKRTLATLQEACPDTRYGATCPNLMNSTDPNRNKSFSACLWTASPHNAEGTDAAALAWSSSEIHSNCWWGNGRGQANYAFCY